jgi:hypothetical protein
MTSVDLLDENCNYEVAMDPAAAMAAAEAAVFAADRVLVRRVPYDGGGEVVEALTTKHTPAWAFLVPFALLPFLRVDRLASITVEPTPSGSVIHARGTLDTSAAQRLRALRAA